MSRLTGKKREMRLMPGALAAIVFGALTLSTATNATILSYDLTVADNFSGVFQSPTLSIAKGTDLDGLIFNLVDPLNNPQTVETALRSGGDDPFIRITQESWRVVPFNPNITYTWNLRDEFGALVATDTTTSILASVFDSETRTFAAGLQFSQVEVLFSQTLQDIGSTLGSPTATSLNINQLVPPAAAPLPPSLALMVSGLGVLAFVRRRRRLG